MKGSVSKRFDGIDSDGDGYLSRQEFAARPSDERFDSSAASPATSQHVIARTEFPRVLWSSTTTRIHAKRLHTGDEKTCAEHRQRRRDCVSVPLNRTPRTIVMTLRYQLLAALAAATLAAPVAFSQEPPGEPADQQDLPPTTTDDQAAAGRHDR